MAEELGLVICNYNKKDDVIDCITSVLENTFTDYHIYAVDNGSTDGSAENIKAHFADEPRLTLIENRENLGGSGGFNTGLRAALAAGHPYLMCVDNDAVLDEGCIASLIAFLGDHPEAGIAAAKIYHRDLPGYIQQYGSFIDYENYAVDSTYLNQPDDGSLPEYVYSDAVPACALMIRSALVEAIGVMPEENFLYWDDTEWCTRCIAAGYKVASVGAAAAAHAMGAKKEDVSTFPTYYAWRNWIKFFLDHLPEEQLPDMAEVFLGSIFETAYEGEYKGEAERTKTVMAALDDALHGVMGKAGEDRIFPIRTNYDPLPKLLEGRTQVILIPNGYPLYAQSLKEKILAQKPKAVVTIGEEAAAGALNIKICESIFREDDLSLKTILCDLSDCMLTNEDEALKVINYPFARRAFVFAMKPWFLRLARELRNRLDH